ncbi:MAG: Xaa-Pro peptidase family protein [Sulfolobus sp.]
MRLYKLEKILEEKNVRCSLILNTATIYYLTGYDYITTDFGNSVALVYCNGEATIITPLLEKNRIESLINTSDLGVLVYSTYADSEGVFKGGLGSAIIEKIKQSNKIAIDLQNITLQLYNSLKDKVELVDISKELNLMRAIKEPEEIEAIKRSGEITASAMKIANEKIQESKISEKQLAGLIDLTMRNEGAEDYAFPSIVAFGENSAFPHHVPTDRIINDGENAVIDIGARYNKYCFDSTRTFIKGYVSSEFKKLYEIVLEAQLSAIDVARDGVKASEVDLVARKVIEKHGYGKYFIHSTGHGVGLEVHEYPPISPNSNVELKENMVITVEPGIYIKGKYGIRIEDTIVITRGKPIVFETVYKYL